MTDLSIILRQEINRCYDVFSKYPRPTWQLNACTCEMCLEPQLEQALRTLPLNELTDYLFYKYNSAPLNKIENSNEIKYFLPRMIELFVQGGRLHHSIELYFERVGNCPNGSFSPKEQTVWQQFADAYLDKMLSVYPYESYEVLKQASLDNIFDFLLMFYKGGIDIEPFLQRWRHTDTPQAIIHYINASYWDFWCYGEYHNAFADDLPKFREIINNWLVDENNKQYFIEQILNLDNHVIEQFYKWNGRYGLIENLFDLMIYDMKTKN